jgi:hypothetical protein
VKTYYLHTLNDELAVLCGHGRSAYLATRGLKKIVLAKHGYPNRRALLRDQEALAGASSGFFEGQRLGYLMVRV